MEVRLVKGRRGLDREGNPEADGRSLMWARPRENLAIDSTMLAIMADFVPQGIGTALGKNAGGNSLDNTLRIRRIVPTDWVLCDIRIVGVHGGVVVCAPRWGGARGGWGRGVLAWGSQHGELRPRPSQSVIVRVRETAEDR